MTTHRAQTADEYGVLFVNLFNMSGISVDQVKHIIISSVVPPVESTLRRVCEKYFHLEPLFVEPGIKTGMPVLVDNPTELGADRLVNCDRRVRALWRPVHRGGLRHGDHVRSDLGQGRVPGRSHCAGPGHQRRRAVCARGRLGRVDIKRPAKVIGTNTVAHLQSGLYYGYIGLVDGILERMVAELGTQPRR